jgi:hypothetical protein
MMGLVRPAFSCLAISTSIFRLVIMWQFPIDESALSRHAISPLANGKRLKIRSNLNYDRASMPIGSQLLAPEDLIPQHYYWN